MNVSSIPAFLPDAVQAQEATKALTESIVGAVAGLQADLVMRFVRAGWQAALGVGGNLDVIA